MSPRSGSTAVGALFSLPGAAEPESTERRELSDVAEQGLAERQIEMHRSGFERCGANGRDPGTPGKGAPRPPPVVGRHTRIVEPSHRRAVQPRLIDRLRSADVAQLRRSVGGHDEHRHGRQAGLDDCRVEIGRSGAAGADQHGGHAAQACSESDERRRSLVVHDMHRQLIAGRNCQRHRCAARAGRNDRGGRSRSDPLVDEGGAERRLHVGGIHRSDDTRCCHRTPPVDRVI